ncbi:aldose epimerase family protein [Antrihabitans cavernicola]|uniref:Uncharacterized protein n=1 Tax=Antrihabitans cavernicola TaxID=2495913 RepID=A0A5A7S0Z1_9NOCA|nr:hypothetical protein [Spelaeibacter cavernicola]KAA0016341.1 hypothetical protein FOY51_26330 [Spelaeibacter cavernicola]
MTSEIPPPRATSSRSHTASTGPPSSKSAAACAPTLWATETWLHPNDRGARCDGAHGTPLAPWPNRLGDGTYTFDGTDYLIALTEPAKRNAIHGFLR